MEVILLQKIHKLGALGDKVNVKSGYARNFLMPKGMALPVTEDNLHILEAKRAELEKEAGTVLVEAQKRHKKLNGMVLAVVVRASEEGKLFGSVGTREISEALQAAGVEVSKSEILLPEGALREIGEFEVTLQLHSDIQSVVKINITAED